MEFQAIGIGLAGGDVAGAPEDPRSGHERADLLLVDLEGGLHGRRRRGDEVHHPPARGPCLRLHRRPPPPGKSRRVKGSQYVMELVDTTGALFKVMFISVAISGWSPL
eukprot:2099823-Heterocapsa_arctica.AAC.1